MWQEAEGDRGELLAEAARTTDLLLARHAKVGGTDAPDVLDQLVTAAGVPVLALPPEASGDLGQTVLVAWNGSREAARAVHDALPFLNAAKARDPMRGRRARPRRASKLRPRCCGGMALPFTRTEWPSRTATRARSCSPRLQRIGADLLVMGAYGHARLRELVFGGATRHVLRAATLPVLFGS